MFAVDRSPDVDIVSEICFVISGSMVPRVDVIKVPRHQAGRTSEGRWGILMLEHCKGTRIQRVFCLVVEIDVARAISIR